MVKSFSVIRRDEVHNLVASIRSTPNATVNMSEKALQLTSSVICRSAFGKDMFFGGTETSSTTIQWALSELMKNPNVMAKAQAEVRWACKGKKDLDDNDLDELKYLKLVIKETLRLHPASPLLGLRECREETMIDGYTIPLKTTVIVNGWAIARDPGSWNNPESFVPERLNNSVDFNGYHFQFIPFGAGSGMCPGMHFGLANVVYPLAQLLYHFNWELPYGLQPEDLDMTETCGISATRKNHLHLIAIPHDTSQYGHKILLS
ncbi:hypothetical protein HAX54_046790 [Datura stramonium]|uniref:Cytochrome P450 n=1 Tax=Datura stramonium TaxID=4076 RepID=A0ABS8SRM8_DATST|nr:hypothetical protein [Datura stramonium]